MATISDVARLAGVAPATVSIALSGNRPVAAETRARVLAAAHELNYQPNTTARNLRDGRTRTIAISMPIDAPKRTISEGPFFRFIASLGDRLSHHGYSMLCLVTKGDGARNVVGLARSGQIDGMLLLEVRLDDPRIAALTREGFPFVSIGRPCPADARGIIRVDADQADAALRAVNHLFELGHQCIAFLGKQATHGFEHQCLLGFQRAYRAHHLPLQRSQLLALEYEDGLNAALKPVTDPASPFTALVVPNDIDAISSLHVLADAGLRVPEHISLVVLGDTTLTELAQPPLTATYLPVDEASFLAVDLLVKLLAGKRPQRLEYILPVHLVVRGSTRRIGPPVAPGCDPSAQVGMMQDTAS